MSPLYNCSEMPASPPSTSAPDRPACAVWMRQLQWRGWRAGPASSPFSPPGSTVEIEGDYFFVWDIKGHDIKERREQQCAIYIYIYILVYTQQTNEKYLILKHKIVNFWDFHLYIQQCRLVPKPGCWKIYFRHTSYVGTFTSFYMLFDTDRQ